MFPATLDLEEFEPTETLVLEQSLFDWRVLPRCLATLFFTPFLLAPIFPLFMTFGENGSSQSVGAAGGVVVIVMFLVFLLFWYGGVTLMIYFAGLVLGCWNRIEFNRLHDEAAFTYEGYFIWGENTTTIPLSQIQDVTVEVTDKGKSEVTMTFEVCYRSAAGGQETDTVSPRFRVRHLDLVEEAMALACAVGNILDLQRFNIEQSDHLETRVQLSPDPVKTPPEKEGDPRPIPSIDSDLNFQDDVHARETEATGTEHPDATRFGRPDIDLPPFDPGRYEDPETRFLQPEFNWNPGERVEINIPPLPTWMRFVAAVFIGGVAGVVLSVFIGGPIRMIINSIGLSVPGWSVGAGIGLFASIITWYYLGHRYCQRDIDLDWNAGRYALRIGRRTLNGSMEEIQSFIVKGYRDQGGDDAPTKYECKVIIDLEDDRETIFWTTKKTNREAVYKHAGSLAEDLADATNVNWKWKGFE